MSEDVSFLIKKRNFNNKIIELIEIGKGKNNGDNILKSISSWNTDTSETI